jgi:hypothetical protein
MAKYLVQMTFDAPGLTERLRTTSRLPGRASSIRMIGGEGTLAVTASRVVAQTPAEAALLVRATVEERVTSAKPLVMRSWTAHRERVLVGGRGEHVVGLGTFPWDDGGDGGDQGGTAGVREPRRPRPGPGSLSAAADLPGPQL